MSDPPPVDPHGETLEVPPPEAGSDPSVDPPPPPGSADQTRPREPQRQDPDLPEVPGYRLWYELGRGAILPPVLMPFAIVAGLFAALYAPLLTGLGRR